MPQGLISQLLYHKPSDPRRFLVKHLEALKISGKRPQLLTRSDLAAMFSMFDITGKGLVTVAQAESALATIGAGAGAAARGKGSNNSGDEAAAAAAAQGAGAAAADAVQQEQQAGLVQQPQPQQPQQEQLDLKQFVEFMADRLGISE